MQVGTSSNETSTFDKTSKVGAIGGGICGISHYLMQKLTIKHPDMFDNFANKTVEKATEKKSYKVVNYLMNQLKNLTSSFKGIKKTNWRNAVIAGTEGALVIAGIYLVAQGIKSLFTKKD